jgi:hypothetical protein
MPQVFFVCRLPASVGRRIFFVEIATRLPYCATLFQGSNFVTLYRLLSGFEICGAPHLPVAASVEILYFSTLEFCRMAKRAYILTPHLPPTKTKNPPKSCFTFGGISF